MTNVEQDITAFKQRLKAAGLDGWTEECWSHGHQYLLESPGGDIRVEFQDGNVLVWCEHVRSENLLLVLQILEGTEQALLAKMRSGAPGLEQIVGDLERERDQLRAEMVQLRDKNASFLILLAEALPWLEDANRNFVWHTYAPEGPMTTFEKTHRGFGLVKFSDAYGQQCSFQESSAATKEFVWVGVDRGLPDSTKGETPSSDGLVDRDNRMHLDRSQAGELGRLLLEFEEKGWGLFDEGLGR